MSFGRPTLSQIVARIEDDLDARLPGADSRLRRNALNVIARSYAGAVHGLYGMLDDISRFLPDVADADRLARWAAIFGLTRKAAMAAAGTVTLAGANGVVVPAGTILVRADGGRYVTTAAATIAGGAAFVPVSAEGAGLAGGMSVGQSVTFLSPVAGVQATAVVAADIVGGADEETDDALRARLLSRIRAPIRGGSASDYIAWATEVAEVTRAWVYPNWDGLGTVKLLFVMDGRDDIIPTGGDIALVAAHIADLRPVTADVTVAAPVAEPIDFTIAATPDTPEVRAAIEAELHDLIAREGEPGGTILISHMREAVSIAAGETDHVMSSPAANRTAAIGAISVLGTITWA
ncbi:MAG: baseplate J/gp47 family protein [Sphingobium sp.]